MSNSPKELDSQSQDKPVPEVIEDTAQNEQSSEQASEVASAEEPELENKPVEVRPVPSEEGNGTGPLPRDSFRKKLYTVIFEADTIAGKAFDVILLIAIFTSVSVVMLDSVKSINTQYKQLFNTLEWFFTILFTLEYVLRIYCASNRIGYVKSFFGIIDFLAIVPSYAGFFFTHAQYMVIVRTLRLLRLFRILKLGRYLKEAEVMSMAIRASRPKILVFLFAVITLVSIIGALMYLIEGGENGFTSIPRSMYWAIVTLTTVGYGDIAPVTILGQILACTVMILGYGIIAVPTGIVSVEMHKANIAHSHLKNCNNCGAKGHDEDAGYCKICGTKLAVIKLEKDPYRLDL